MLLRGGRCLAPHSNHAFGGWEHRVREGFSAGVGLDYSRADDRGLEGDAGGAMMDAELGGLGLVSSRVLSGWNFLGNIASLF